MFHFFMENLFSSALHTLLTSKHKARTRAAYTRKTTALPMNPQVVDYLLQTYITDESIADTKGTITTFTQPPNKTSSQYAEKRKDKLPRCGDVFKETVLKKFHKKIRYVHETKHKTILVYEKRCQSAWLGLSCNILLSTTRKASRNAIKPHGRH